MERGIRTGGSSGVQRGSSVCEVLCTPVSLRLWP